MHKKTDNLCACNYNILIGLECHLFTLHKSLEVAEL